MKGRRLRDRTEARRLLKEWELSGEPMRKWCEARGLSWGSMAQHRRFWLADQRQVQREKVDFVEVVPTSVPGRRSARYRLFVGAGVVEVGEDFDDDTLRRLLHLMNTC